MAKPPKLCVDKPATPSITSCTTASGNSACTDVLRSDESLTHFRAMKDQGLGALSASKTSLTPTAPVSEAIHFEAPAMRCKLLKNHLGKENT